MRSHLRGRGPKAERGMSVHDATVAELKRLKIDRDENCEAEVALTLAACLDGEKRTQNGGEAAIAKQYLAVMVELRERYKPKGASRLELLRGGAEQAS